MSVAKDPVIKLFGKTILPVPEIRRGSAGDPPSSSGDVVDQNHASSTDSSRVSHNNRGSQEQQTEKDTLGEKPTDIRKEDGAPMQLLEELRNPYTASRTGEKAITTERGSTTLKTSKSEEGQSQTSNSQGKNLKKPAKIPCPRCNSMDTKFCYYNNYSVNQPRHFCKKCNRYWTAGGTMRNVPIGAGRKKKGNSSPHNHPITVSEAAIQNTRTDLPNGATHHPSLKCNRTVLTFGSNRPLCESMASGLELADKSVNNYKGNGFHKPEELRIHVPHVSGEKWDDQSNKSSVISIRSKDAASASGSQEQNMQNYQSFPPQVPYYPGTARQSPWNPVQWSSSPPPPTFGPPGFAMSTYPTTPFWGGTWNIPLLAQPSSPNGAASNSPTMGKHSREENMLRSSESGSWDGHNRENRKEKCLWAPKTLKVDESRGATKSTMLTSLGIENNKAESILGGGLFTAFTSKHDQKNHSVQASPLLQANPTAFSRSLNFHETS